MVPTRAEIDAWYFEGLYEGAASEPSDHDGRSSGRSDTDASDPEDPSGRPLRQRRVRFDLPRQTRTRGDSRGGVGGHPEVRYNICTVFFII